MLGANFRELYLAELRRTPIPRRSCIGLQPRLEPRLEPRLVALAAELLPTPSRARLGVRALGYELLGADFAGLLAVGSGAAAALSVVVRPATPIRAERAAPSGGERHAALQAARVSIRDGGGHSARVGIRDSSNSSGVHCGLDRGDLHARLLEGGLQLVVSLCAHELA